jgi:50S ribosomal subunit-associated GTPase HflX
VDISTCINLKLVQGGCKKLTEVKAKEQYCVEILNRFAALENLDDEVHINRVWETIRENIKISTNESLGYYELKKHKARFDKGCSDLLDQRKQAKLQWLQDPSKINGDNPNNVRCEASTCFRIKKREYMKDKINELATNSKNKNIRGSAETLAT